MSSNNDGELKVISKVAEYRKRKNLSQDALAQILGTTKTTIQNWESGRSLGAVIRLLRLCLELDADLRDLFPVSKEKNEEKRGE